MARRTVMRISLADMMSTIEEPGSTPAIYPRARALVDEAGAKGFAHLRWTEENGDSVFVELVQEHNATVHASIGSATLYAVAHRVTDFDALPVSEEGRIVGTYLKLEDANKAAWELINKDGLGWTIAGIIPQQNPDRTIFFESQSAGTGGRRWTTEVLKSIPSGHWANE
ncbi:hypothetical protein MMC11_006077 [Xylographa trunciseda]|nr:hypothetical protein [Xylographa trunciseda]